MNQHLIADPTLGNMGGWQERHNAAVSAPRAGLERAIVCMLTGWLEYAAAHQDRYENAIGNDGFLGEHWEAMGRAILGLLNGEHGRLDCGTLDKLIRETMRDNAVISWEE